MSAAPTWAQQPAGEWAGPATLRHRIAAQRASLEKDYATLQALVRDADDARMGRAVPVPWRVWCEMSAGKWEERVPLNVAREAGLCGNVYCYDKRETPTRVRAELKYYAFWPLVLCDLCHHENERDNGVVRVNATKGRLSDGAADVVFLDPGMFLPYQVAALAGSLIDMGEISAAQGLMPFLDADPDPHANYSALKLQLATAKSHSARVAEHRLARKRLFEEVQKLEKQAGAKRTKAFKSYESDKTQQWKRAIEIPVDVWCRLHASRALWEQDMDEHPCENLDRCDAYRLDLCHFSGGETHSRQACSHRVMVFPVMLCDWCYGGDRGDTLCTLSEKGCYDNEPGYIPFDPALHSLTTLAALEEELRTSDEGEAADELHAYLESVKADAATAPKTPSDAKRAE